MAMENPVGTNGFAFLEYTTTEPDLLVEQFKSLGLHPVAKHNTHDVVMYQQNDIRFLINLTPNSHAIQFAKKHGASASAMAFHVCDAKATFDYVVRNGATPYHPKDDVVVYDIPVIQGVGGSLIYFVDNNSGALNYEQHFTPLDIKPTVKIDVGLTYIDHVTHNLQRGNMEKWADFYTKLFNFHEVRYFDIEGKMTGLKSKAMASPCGKIRIPLNESSDDKSQIEEFIHDFHGEGIQHIALGTDNIYDSVKVLRNNGLEFLDTPDTYYELIEKRLPKHGEPLEKLKALRILVDGTTKKERKLLLQIFTKNMLGPVFFEVIQRKGDEGFGEGNFKALFESIELDQIRRGVLTEDKEIA